MREETGATPKTVSNWIQLFQLMWCSRRSRIVIRLSSASNMLSAMCIKASHICAKLRGTPKLKLRLHGGIVRSSRSQQFGWRNPAVIAMSAWFRQAWMNAKFGDDLDADSLDLVELVMALEEEFDIAVPEEDLEGVETVKNAYDLVTGKL